MSGSHVHVNAVSMLIADARRTLALTEFEDTRGNRDHVRQTIAEVHGIYDGLLRRAVSTAMSSEERAAFQSVMDRLRASLRFFGEAV
jgi:hypothetical protein